MDAYETRLRAAETRLAALDAQVDGLKLADVKRQLEPPCGCAELPAPGFVELRAQRYTAHDLDLAFYLGAFVAAAAIYVAMRLTEED